MAFRVDEVEIYEALERRLEQRQIVEARRLEPLDTRLAGPESAATLQQKRDTVEGRPMFQLVRPSQVGRQPGHGDSLLVAVVVGVAAQRARNKYVHRAGKGLEIELRPFPAS